jgi:hypothetical protein
MPGTKQLSGSLNLTGLLGDWQRMNDRPGRTTFEHWSRISPSEYQGLGYTLRNGDTIFKEYHEIARGQGRLDF